MSRIWCSVHTAELVAVFQKWLMDCGYGKNLQNELNAFHLMSGIMIDENHTVKKASWKMVKLPNVASVLPPMWNLHESVCRLVNRHLLSEECNCIAILNQLGLYRLSTSCSLFDYLIIGYVGSLKSDVARAPCHEHPWTQNLTWQLMERIQLQTSVGFV